MLDIYIHSFYPCRFSQIPLILSRSAVKSYLTQAPYSRAPQKLERENDELEKRNKKITVRRTTHGNSSHSCGSMPSFSCGVVRVRSRRRSNVA